MKEIFVFGAGASHASANTPLGENLVWDYYADCSLFHEWGSNGKPTQISITHTQKEFSDLSEFLKSESKWKHYADSLEQGIKDGYFRMINVPKEYYVDELVDDLQKRDKPELIKLVKCLTVKHITGAGESANNLYKKFVETLSEKSASEVTIISFNFDCLLHEDFKKRIYFDYLLDFKTIANRGGYKKGEGFPLIKPNGSLDWALNPRTQEIHLFFWHIRPFTYNFDFKKSDTTDMVEPYIFLPHQIKNGPINMLWERAKLELNQAQKITIIGYSFPPYDTDVIKLFQENLRNNVELEIVDFQIDPQNQSEIQNKYKRLFPNIKNIKFVFDGFAGYMSRKTSNV